MPTRSLFRPVLAGSIASLLLASYSHAADGTWLGAPTNSNWSNAAFWQNGVIADGINATAYLVFDPIADADLTRGANVTLDSSRTLGNIYFGDVDGLGSSSLGLFPANGSTLTLQTSGATPIIEANLLLNNSINGKKAIFNANLTLAGTQGFNKTGLGYFSLRNPVTMSGAIGVLGGTLDTRTVLNNDITVSGGSLSLDFANFTGTNDIINSSRTLTLGGVNGSGAVTTASKAAVLSQSLAGLTLNAGANSIQAAANSAANTFTWNLGTITRNNGSALNLFGANSFNFQFTSGGSVQGNDSGGIVGGWLTFNSNDWGRVNGAAITAAGVPYTNNAWGFGLNTTVNAVNFPSVAGATTQTDAFTHTLRFQDANARFLTLTGTNTIETGGLLFGNAGNAMHQLNGGAITSGSGDLIIHGYSTGGGWGVLINSDIVDNGAPVQLVKAGTGNVVLDGDKTFTGGTVLGQGTLVLGKALGGSATGSVTGNIVNSGVLAFNRSGSYTPGNTITGNGVIAQWSDGTLVLNKSVSSGGLNLQNGTTILDFTGAAAPQNNIVPAGVQTGTGLWTDGSRLTLRDATLGIVGKPGVNHNQTFALTDLQGSSSLNLQPGSGGTVTINLGAYNRPNNSNDGAGTLKITLPAGATVAVMPSFPGAASGLVQDNGQAFVTVNGTDWGAKNAANTQIISGSDLAGGTFYTPLSALTNGSNANYDVDTTVSVNTTLASLRFHNVPTTATLNINAGQQIFVGGLLISSNALAATQITGEGSISAANTGGRDLPVFQNSAQPLTISAVVADNAAGQITNLIKEGIGELILSATNTFTGKTYVQGGTLRLTGGGIGAVTPAGNIFIREGEMRLENSAVVNTGGNFISIGERLGETGTLTLRDSSSWTTTGDFNVSDVNSTGILNVRDNALLNATNFFVGKVGASVGIVNFSGGTIAINGGGGDVRIGGINSSDTLAQGTINQSGGTFLVNRNFQLGANGVGTYNHSEGTFQSTAGFTVLGRFVSGQGTWNLSGGTIDTSAPAAGAAVIIGEEGSGTLNVSGTGNVIARDLSVGHNNGVGEINQTGGTVNLTDIGVAAGLNYAQAGVVLGGGALGNINNSGGTYRLGGGTLNTNAITRAVGRGDFVFNGGTLRPITTNTAFMQGLTSATVRAGGAIIDTGGNDINIGQSLSHDEALGATRDGGLTKIGAGTLSLHGANSYTGATTISAGTLKLAPSEAAAVWDASTLTGADGTSVGTWTDSVGFKNAAQATAGNQPQLINGSLNGHNVLHFEGSASQSLVVANTDSAISANSSFTIAVVVRTPNTGVGGAAQWWSNTGIVDAEIANGNNDWGLGYNGNGSVSGGLGSFGNDQTLYSSTGISDGNAHVLLLSVNNGTIQLAVDGVTETLGTSNIGARALNQFRIGGISTGSNFFTGDIAEVQLFRSGMSGAALSAAGQQLATKYGLTGTYSKVSDFLPDASNVNLAAAGATLDLNGFSETVGSLSGVAGSIVALSGGTLTVGADNSSTSFGGSISGAGTLAKSGTGNFTLGAGSTAAPAGGTLIDGGRLLVNGSLSGSVAVHSGGSLGGSGTITTNGGSAIVALGGTLAPGASAAGNLTVILGGGELDLGAALAPLASGALLFELGSLAVSDKVTLSGGSLNIGSGLLEFDDFAFTQLAGFAPGTYTLFDGNSSIVGTLGASQSGVIGNFLGDLSFADGGRDLILTVAVPEPGTLVSLLGGLGILALRRRRR